jgi:hypothetical protein
MEVDKRHTLKALRELDEAIREVEVESGDHAINVANRLKALRERVADIADGLKEEKPPQK